MITILTFVFLAFGCPDWLLYPEVPNICKACSYHFFHANVFHLAVNCLSIYAIYRPSPWRDERYILKEFLEALTISTLAWFTAFSPVVGVSNYLFAVLGLRTPHFRSTWWRSSTTLTFLSVMFLMIFIPKVSASTHIVSFAAGTLVARLREVTDGR